MPNPGPTLTHPDTDPFLWLEEVESEAATAWANTQSAATLSRFGDAAFAADSTTLRELLDRPDNLPYPARRGGLIYNFWKDATHKRGLWRRTTLASYESQATEWDILLDLDLLAEAESEDWIWQGASTLPPRHSSAMVRLSRGGSDAVVLREFDLSTRSFVTDGFVLPEAKGGCTWLDGDTLLLYSALGGATKSGYASTIRLWRRGTNWSDAKVLFTAGAESMNVGAEFDRALDRVIFVERTGFFDATVWLGDRTGPQQRIDLPTDAWYSWDAGWLAVRARTAWTAGEQNFLPDAVVVTRLDDFLAGKRDFRIVFEPSPLRSIQGFFWAAGHLLLNILDDLRPLTLSLEPPNWQPVPLQGLPSVGAASVWRLDIEDEESDGTLLAVTQDPITPPTLKLATRRAAPYVLRQLLPAFDPSALVVTRHDAISIDGEKIPYVQCGPAGETGDAPVHLTGYGGFAVSSQPVYRIATGKLWLERGGTTVLAHIRGGGEFGTRWHDAGRRAGKRLSHDDFAAVAADLVRRGVTNPSRIAAEGGSNGGLLIANMLTRYPERFGALFCTIPLIDMRRYAQLLAGASWIAEYGDPADAADWDFLGPISAYHTAEPGRAYPPILLATSRRDDRVHPGHARKMAAKLQAMGYDALFYEPAAGGHGYGKDNTEIANFAALGMNFLRRAIGWAT